MLGHGSGASVRSGSSDLAIMLESVTAYTESVKGARRHSNLSGVARLGTLLQMNMEVQRGPSEDYYHLKRALYELPCSMGEGIYSREPGHCLYLAASFSIFRGSKAGRLSCSSFLASALGTQVMVPEIRVASGQMPCGSFQESGTLNNRIPHIGIHK